MNELCDLPTQWWGEATTEEEAAGVAASELMSHLGRIRGVGYEPLDRPDVTNRSSKAADYRYISPDIRGIVAVEVKRFVLPEDREAAAHLKAGKRFRPKGRVRPTEFEGEQYGSISFGDAKDEVRELRDFIVQAIERGQLQAVEASERVLLILDGRYVYRDLLRRTDFSFSQSERDTVDHVFLLSPGSGGRDPKPSKIFQMW